MFRKNRKTLYQKKKNKKFPYKRSFKRLIDLEKKKLNIIIIEK